MKINGGQADEKMKKGIFYRTREGFPLSRE